jgi:endonuclease YncB( thermonuclease family)
MPQHLPTPIINQACQADARAQGRGLARIVILLLATISAFPLQAGRHLEGLAIVRSDGTLLVKEQVVHLHGIYIPATNRQCRDWIRPVRCDSRAVLALDFRVKGFINCYVEHENEDGSLSATCYADRTSFDPGEDLAAYLIKRGWALALPNAPFEYHALEKIANKQEVGVWGYSADSFSDRVFPQGSRKR